MDWVGFDNKQLLSAYCSLMAELKNRNIVRGSNNPIGDYTESLIAKALGLSIELQSQAGYDACSMDGTRYQIKGRRLTSHNKSTQLSAIRNLNLRPFDFLAAVMYSQDLEILYAALIPFEVVAELSRFSKHSNSHIFMFKQSVFHDPRVTDITKVLNKV